MKNRHNRVEVQLSISNLNQWVLERLWSSNTKDAFEERDEHDVVAFARRMEILATIIAAKMSENKPLVVEECWVPDLTKKNQSFQILLARMTRDFRVERERVRDEHRHLRAA